jgi:mono/diheme cytochrome c family protein
MEEVFVGRMGGVKESPERLAALENWLFAIKSQPPRRAATDELALRGQALFESEAVGCSTCHSGAAFTNNLSYNVGTTATAELFQVPSLIGISYRSPLMHTGCAATLRDRFEPSCGGGDLHGVTSTLPPEDIDALVAYLETL